MRYAKSVTFFGNETQGTKTAYAGGGGGAVYWSAPVDISHHDGTSMYVGGVYSGGGVGTQIDIYTYGTGDPTASDAAPANDGRAYGYANMATSGLTAGGETLIAIASLSSSKRFGRWARAKLTVGVGVTVSVFVQLDIREDI